MRIRIGTNQYTHEGVGGQARLVTDRALETLSVQDFGALGVGTDDLAALNYAVDKAESSGHILRLPAGIYGVPVNGDKISIVDDIIIEGEAGTVIQVLGTPSSTTNVFNIAAGAHATFRNLKIIGPSGGDSCQGIVHAGTSGGVTVENCEIEIFDVAIKLSAGTLRVNIWDSHIHDINLVGVQSGIGVSGSTLKNTYDISRNYFIDIGDDNNEHALYLESPFESMRIVENYFKNMVGAALHRANGNGLADSGCCIFSDNIVIDCGTSGGGAVILDDTGSYSALIRGNHIQTSHGMNVQCPRAVIEGNEIDCTGIGIVVQGSNGKYASIGKNTFTGTGNHIQLASSSQIGCRLYDNNHINLVSNSSASVTIVGALDTSIQGGTFVLNGGTGVNLQSSADRFMMRGVTMLGASDGTGGVYVRSSCADPMTAGIEDNNFQVASRSATIEVAGVRWHNPMDSTGIVVSAGKTIHRHPGWAQHTATIASASTVSIPRNVSIIRVTGTTTINTLEFDGVSTDAPIMGPIFLVLDNGTSFGSGGNIIATGRPRAAGHVAAFLAHRNASGVRFTEIGTDMPLEFSAALDFPSTNDGAVSDLTLTCTGAAFQDSIALGPPNDVTAGCSLFAKVTSADTITVSFINNSGGTVNPGSLTIKGKVFK